MFANPRRSSRRLRPGCDGKRPSEAGTVTAALRWRSGSRRAKRRAPSARSARQFSSSRPSSLGTVRASWMPMIAESSAVQGAGVRSSSTNSRGRSDGSAATRSIQAFTPSA